MREYDMEYVQELARKIVQLLDQYEVEFEKYVFSVTIRKDAHKMSVDNFAQDQLHFDLIYVRIDRGLIKIAPEL
jgi:hypothetical protein